MGARDTNEEAYPTGQPAPQPGETQTNRSQTPDELREETHKLRRLQMMMNVVMSVIGQDRTLTVDQASQLVADSRNAALAMFPDKEVAYNLIYKPRLQRLMQERYRMQ